MVLVLAMSLLAFLLIHIDADIGADKNSQDLKPQEARILHINLNNAEKDQTIDIPVVQALFKLGFHFGTDKTPKTIDVGFKPELDDFYHRVGFATKSQNVIVVYPIFTQAALESGDSMIIITINAIRDASWFPFQSELSHITLQARALQLYYPC